jgi:hypothetical protein
LFDDEDEKGHILIVVFLCEVCDEGEKLKEPFRSAQGKGGGMVRVLSRRTFKRHSGTQDESAIL